MIAEINLEPTRPDAHRLAEQVILEQAKLIESQLIIDEGLRALAMRNAQPTRAGTPLSSIINDITTWPDLITYSTNEQGHPYLRVLLLPRLLTDRNFSGLTTPLPINMICTSPYFIFATGDEWAVHPHIAVYRTCLGNLETASRICAESNSVSAMVDLAHTFVSGYDSRSPLNANWPIKAEQTNRQLRHLSPKLRQQITEWDGEHISYNNNIVSLSELLNTDDTLEINICLYILAQVHTLDGVWGLLSRARDLLDTSKSKCSKCCSPLVRVFNTLLCASSLLPQKYCTSQYTFISISYPTALVSFHGTCLRCETTGVVCYGLLHLADPTHVQGVSCINHLSLRLEPLVKVEGILSPPTRDVQDVQVDEPYEYTSTDTEQETWASED